MPEPKGGWERGREGGGLTDGGFFPPGTHVRVDSRPSVRPSVPNADRRLARFLSISPSLPRQPNEGGQKRTGCWDAREREKEGEGGRDAHCCAGTKTRLLSPSPSTLTFDKKEARIQRLHTRIASSSPSPSNSLTPFLPWPRHQCSTNSRVAHSRSLGSLPAGKCEVIF